MRVCLPIALHLCHYWKEHTLNDFHYMKYFSLHY